MAKPTAPIQIALFFLLAACGALPQSAGPLADLLRRDGSTSPDRQRQEVRSGRSLPDAPSIVQPPTQAEKFQTFVDQARLPLTFGAAGMNAGLMSEIKLGYITRGLQRRSASYIAFRQKQSNTFFAPAKITFAPTFGLVHHETIGANDLESYGRRIPWAGPVMLRISQEAKTHPHITRALMMVQPRF